MPRQRKLTRSAVEGGQAIFIATTRPVILPDSELVPSCQTVDLDHCVAWSHVWKRLASGPMLEELLGGNRTQARGRRQGDAGEGRRRWEGSTMVVDGARESSPQTGRAFQRSFDLAVQRRGLISTCLSARGGLVCLFPTREESPFGEANGCAGNTGSGQTGPV